MKAPKSGDIYMSAIRNFHLFINEEQYVHLVTGDGRYTRKKLYGVDPCMQYTSKCGSLEDWTYVCNVGKLLCDITKQECSPMDTVLKILDAGSMEDA